MSTNKMFKFMNILYVVSLIPLAIFSPGLNEFLFSCLIVIMVWGFSAVGCAGRIEIERRNRINALRLSFTRYVDASVGKIG